MDGTVQRVAPTRAHASERYLVLVDGVDGILTKVTLSVSSGGPKCHDIQLQYTRILFLSKCAQHGLFTESSLQFELSLSSILSFLLFCASSNTSRGWRCRIRMSLITTSGREKKKQE